MSNTLKLSMEQMNIKYFPLYFLIVGLPSVIWGMVKKPEQSYFSFYTEKWANHLGEKFTGKKSMEMLDI